MIAHHALLAVVLLAGCASPRTTPGDAQDQSPRDGTSAAAGQSRTEQAAALGAVEELEAAVSAARTAVDSASAGAETATAEQRLRLSDTRRAIVAANVALQKAREALGRGDYAAASQATLGVAEHLKGILKKLRG
jgi:predicted lipid-binding transport protein (Tim44 family)